MSNYLYATLAALGVVFNAGAATTNFDKNKLDAATHWADSVYSTLSERQRIAQLVFPKVVPTETEATKAALRRLIETDGCGGLLFTEGTAQQHAFATNYAQSVAKVPVMMTFDGEWGLSMRIKDTPRFPHNMALGAISDYRLLYEYGKEMARECRIAGVHVNFAPDADVNSNPANPVIGYRAFGEDPERVAKASTAYSLGMEDGGVQAVAKHFPGHGDTSTDSHKALTVVNHTRQRLDSTDMVPFRDFIESGCSGIMVGHIAVPALDAAGTPASLSKKITDGVLRNELGFEGLIYTDALGMKGATHASSTPATDALLAGADVLLCPEKPREAINDILAAVQSGKISTKTIEDRCKRVLRYKYYLACGESQVPSGKEVLKQTNSPQADALIKKLAEVSITVLRNKNNLLPFGNLDTKRISVVNIGERSDNDFVSTCREYAPVKAYYTLNETFSEASLAKINNADAVVVAVYNDKPETRRIFEQLARTSPNLTAVFLINPYKMNKFADMLGNVNSIVLAYDNIAPERISAAQALFGGIATSGRLPVHLKGLAPMGTGIELQKNRLGISSPVAESMQAWLTDSIDALIAKGLRTGAFPGCQVLIAKNGNIVHNKNYGRLSSDANSEKVTAATIYDLASVSKATGTLAGIMKAYDQGKISLDATLAELIPELADSAKKEITVRQLLYHETGMPAALNMFNVMMDTLSYSGQLITARPDKNHSIKIQNRAYGHNTAKLRRDITAAESSSAFPVKAAEGLFTGKSTYDSIMGRIYNIPLRANRNFNYSCLNFCILMDIEQRATGQRHNDFVKNEVFAPMGAYSTGYRPTEWAEAKNIAPTEKDTFLRRQTLKGFVHDELANFSGGVQGNAGLFANASDVAKYCQMLLNGGYYGDKRILSEETVKLFTTSKSPTCRRGLGFDKPDKENPDNSPTCDEANPEVFGHLGFTGTVFWVDPKEDLIFVFLCNRVNPTRDNSAFSKLNIRPHLFSLVYKSLNN
ncbi:MAG: serine hydrolase [Muribaculaceae bacterium]|nr:serine hydrolase [Muribaculaceae bacterium]